MPGGARRLASLAAFSVAIGLVALNSSSERGDPNAALPNSDSILEKGRSSSRNPAIFSVKEAINAKGNFSRGNEGLAFAKWATGWVQSIRGAGSLPVLTLGQGGEWSGINCSVLSTRGSSRTPREKCRHLERALADEYSLLDKHVSGFLSKLLTGDPDSAKRAGNRLAGPDMAKISGPFSSFGGGAGAGFQVFCGNDVIVSVGGGGGGGRKHGIFRRGGGGGMQLFNVTGSGSTMVINTGGGSDGTTFRWDPVATSRGCPRLDARAPISRCPGRTLRVLGGGGGGAGVSLSGQTHTVGFSYFYFSAGIDGGPIPSSDPAAMCSHLPCAPWRRFARFGDGVQCEPCDAAGNG